MDAIHPFTHTHIHPSICGRAGREGRHWWRGRKAGLGRVQGNCLTFGAKSSPKASTAHSHQGLVEANPPHNSKITTIIKGINNNNTTLKKAMAGVGRF
jgi:hypothetical protein